MSIKIIVHFFLFFFITFFWACGKKGNAAIPLFQLQTNTGIDFINNVQNERDFNIFTYRNFYNGGGVAIGDINNDGLADIFFTANMSTNKLYLNKGNFQFEDISAKAGIQQLHQWSTGVVMVDVNNDHWLDIFVCNAGYENNQVPECKLFINNHDLTFTDSAAAYGLTNRGGYTTHAAFFDYDLDGDLDCFIINNSFIPVNTLNYANKRDLRAKDWPVADFLKGGGDHLYRNDNGKYVDVSEKAGIHGSLISFGLGVTVGDVNGDHYPDVYVSNDFFERDYLYINQKNGTFHDDIENWVQHSSLASMGADIGDINNDGYPDIFTTDMLPSDDYRLKTTSSFDNIDVYRLKEKSGFYHQFMQNTLQLNNGNDKFSEIAHYSGVAASDWSWGGIFFDADNDGNNDLFVCNGIYHDVTNQDFIDFFANDVMQKMALTGKKEQVDTIINKMPSVPIPNKAFSNNGDLTFSDSTDEWGLAQPSFSNGSAYGDLDNDGDLDLVVNNVNEKAFVYKNNGDKLHRNNYLEIKLEGTAKNTFAIGSAILVYAGKDILTREVMPSRGFQSSVDYKTVIGLGNKKPDSLQIIWPDLSITTINNPTLNKILSIRYNDTTARYTTIHTGPRKSSNSVALLQPVVQNFEKHTENDYIDFYEERNIPFMLSKEGPKAAIGDVNGDGLSDIFIGGTAGNPGQIYLQSAKGFVKKEEEDFKRYAMFEDIAAFFFDCDGDGDLDLFVGSGGNDHPVGRLEMQNRLYRNDGKGNFTADSKALPASGMNNATVVAADFDGDGDVDLFVGSRSIPQNYGPSPYSFIYINDGKGMFTDIAKTKNPDIANIGLVTGAIWADVTGDKKEDLIIVGEWMNPRIFSFTGDHFTEIKTNLSDMFGLWQAVAAADLDGDGDMDIVLGNIGENFYLKPNNNNPVKLWINDFDNNGTVDKILTRSVNGKDVTVFLKKDVTDQIPSLRKNNLRYEEFADKSFQQLFAPEVLQKTAVKQFNYPSSCIAYNEGNGKFKITALPQQVQFSSVNAILCTDINNDDKSDIIIGGNKFGFQPQFGRLDASYGSVLKNNGNENFSYLEYAESGLQLDGQVRDIKLINIKGEKNILFLRNDDYPALYKAGSFK
ncbi:CRTAC1 family protein [Panacibacter ginsenosidivorans]|uniref:CRTAC1 family protein n=2 Tax=Panacibacter ginsenosidivorans TaxID=1813871 RepID=A0A5B8VI09_9BACT|nr:CRTAC1 family protein [Panacibacter ginsenosidivorans]